nr:probable carboxylesterase 1 [Coffea arabica]
MTQQIANAKNCLAQVPQDIVRACYCQIIVTEQRAQTWLSVLKVSPTIFPPEHPVPRCYDDSWAVINWVIAHAKDRQVPDSWINNHADFTKVIFSGDSVGGNIAHNMAVRAGQEGLGDGVKLEGVILMHPFFGDGKPNKLWELICSDFKGWD